MRLFGTDGVRGVANADLTAQLAFSLGQAGAYVLSSENAHQARILVGMDTRVSGHMLEAALVSGICSVGAEAVCAGVIPTPAVAYLTRKYGLDAGIMITASHNPMEDNGIKFFNHRGFKLSDETEDKIETIIKEKTTLPQPTGAGVGCRVTAQQAVRDYVELLKTMIPLDLTGWRICIDCANGAAYRVAPTVLRELGAEVRVLFDKPDGLNINDGCGSTHIEALQREVVAWGAHIGLAFDGDADRLLAVDETGRVLDGDRLMLICGVHRKNEGRLVDDVIVSTVMSNMGFEAALRERGCRAVRTAVGDRYVLENMIENGYILGGEQSGHVIFLDRNTTGDAMVTALEVLSALLQSHMKPSQGYEMMREYPQVLVNARVKPEWKANYMKDEIVMTAIEELEAQFAGEGRVLIRASGTEPLVRVMIEGKEQKQIEEEANRLAALMEQRLG